MASKDNRPESTVLPTDTTGSPQVGSLRLEPGLNLRQRAEMIYWQKAAKSSINNLETLSTEEIRRIFHELQVHQIELEMQNDDLRRAEDELEAARARYFDLYDLAPVGYCTISEKGLILEANLTAATLLGVIRGALIRRPISRFILKEDQDIYYLYRKQLLGAHSVLRQGSVQADSEQAGAPQGCDLRMVNKYGTAFWAHLKMTVAQEADGASVYRVVLSDISERKQAEAQHILLKDQQRKFQKAESLERMAGAIAHLFNNQLCVVLGNLEMTLKDMVGDALPRQYLVNAMWAARQSANVSRLLMTYLGQSNGKPEPLDLSKICHRNLARLQDAMPSAITLEADLISPGPIAYADANQIQQVLAHLVTNGWEAIGDRAGRVTLATKTVSASDIPKSHVSSSDWRANAEMFACLEVTDTGCGMTEEEMDKIFDPFFTTKFAGRGLSLAVDMGLVKTWGGVIGVESAVGEGSTFRVFVPLVVDEAPRQVEMLSESWDFETGGTVLLVEDQEEVRDITEIALKRLGFEVVTAADGKEAIALFRKHQESIQCVITDLSMPGMDGWDTIAALRKIQPRLPVILASGYDEAQAMNGEYVEQPQAFLHKPYSMYDLKNVLGLVLEKANNMANEPPVNQIPDNAAPK